MNQIEIERKKFNKENKMAGVVLANSGVQNSLPPALDTANQYVQELVATVANLAAIQMANQNQVAYLNKIVTIFGMVSLGTAIGTLINSCLAIGQEAKINELAGRIGALEKAKQIKNKGE